MVRQADVGRCLVWWVGSVTARSEAWTGLAACGWLRKNTIGYGQWHVPAGPGEVWFGEVRGSARQGLAGSVKSGFGSSRQGQRLDMAGHVLAWTGDVRLGEARSAARLGETSSGLALRGRARHGKVRGTAWRCQAWSGQSWSGWAREVRGKVR